jgi:NAD-dependent dihydropyrimidine dehydrogenase PreA subunit
MPQQKIDPSKCSGDGTCVYVCPVGVYEIKKDRVVAVNPEACIGCRACEVQCPNSAITIES